MAHTYTCLLYHCVFSTKNRTRSIPAELQPALWAYMGGIARTNHFKALAVGGTDDHAHLLLSLPPALPVAKAMQLIKAGSSKWVREETTRLRFAWQESYYAFTVGISQVEVTKAYIANQARHHARRNFDDELRAFMKKHGIPFDEK